MKMRTRQLAKPGIFGTKDNPKVVTEDDLKQIAKTFPEIETAPVSLNGHRPDSAAPRLGNVIEVVWDEASSTLIGTIEEQDELAEAVKDGYYPDVSIGARRRASDGALYLHHLAYLGEEPPAIKDLVAEVKSSLKEMSASDGEADFIIPAIRTRLLLSDTEENAGVAGERKNKEEKELEEKLSQDVEIKQLTSELKSARAESEKYKAQMADLAQKYPDEISLSDADTRVATLMAQLRGEKIASLKEVASGKVPKARMHLVEALARALPLGQSIELSDSDGHPMKSSAMEVLGQIFASLPSPVVPGKLELSDTSEEEKPVDVTGIMRRI